MKILEINLARSWRGGERQTFYTSKSLLDKGHEVTVLCSKGGQLADHCNLQQIPTALVTGSMAMARWLSAYGASYDIIHCQGSKELTWCILTKKIHNRPVVLSRRVNFKPKGALTAWKYRKTDAVVGVSEAIRETLLTFGVKNVQVIPSAFLPTPGDERKIAALREEFNIGNRKVIGTAAAMTSEKDPFTLVDAVKRLYEKRQDFIFLHFGDGVLKEKVMNKIQAAGLAGIYFTPGHRDQVEQVYPLMDVFAMSSLEEGLGSSVLDAFYHRIPVVATAAGGLKNLLDNGRGLLCETGDDACLANGMNNLLDRNEEHLKMTEKAYDYLLENHGISHCTEQYLALFRQLAPSS